MEKNREACKFNRNPQMLFSSMGKKNQNKTKHTIAVCLDAFLA